MMPKYMQLAFLSPLNICLFFCGGSIQSPQEIPQIFGTHNVVGITTNFKGLLEFSHKDKYYSSATLKCSFSRSISLRIKMHAKSSVMNKMGGSKVIKLVYSRAVTCAILPVWRSKVNFVELVFSARD